MNNGDIAMNMKLFAVGSAVFLTLSLSAQTPEGNLVPDYDMKTPAVNWKITPAQVAFIPDTVERFNGSDEILHFITFPRTFWLRSGDMTVTQETEYVAELYFRNPGKIIAKQPGIRFAVYSGDKPMKTVLANNVQQWKPLRLFFNSGKASSVNLRIAGSAPGISIGRITLAPVGKDTDRFPVVMNDTAKENVGDICSDFRHEGTYNDFVLVEENGEKFYRITVPAGKRTLLSGLHFLMRENEALKGAVQVRLAKEAKLRFEVNGILGLYSRNVDSKSVQPAGEWITLSIDRALPSRQQVLKIKHIKNATTIFNSDITCRPLIYIMDSAEENVVDIKGLELEVTAPAQ